MRKKGLIPATVGEGVLFRPITVYKTLFQQRTVFLSNIRTIHYFQAIMATQLQKKSTIEISGWKDDWEGDFETHFLPLLEMQ